MKTAYRFIFDMDGTLYSLGKGFAHSTLLADIMSRISHFFQNRLGLTESEAQAEYERLKTLFRGEVSLAVEHEYGIDRFEYFAQTWNCQPEKHVAPNPKLSVDLYEFSGRAAILSAAPRVWVQAVLAHLRVEEIFNPLIFTGEPNIRKPNPEAFRQVSTALQAAPQMTFSIGDQETTDMSSTPFFRQKVSKFVTLSEGGWRHA